MKTTLSKFIKTIAIHSVLLLTNTLMAQTYTFLTAGATGNTGPTQAQLDSTYASCNLNGMVVSNAGIQTLTVPISCFYYIEARGAQGGSEMPLKFGGKGSIMSGHFNLTSGTILKILVGQEGSSSNGCYGGGGGSFVSTITNSPLIIAGGGGGAGGSGGGNGADASIGNSGTAGLAGGAGGTNGNGGVAANTNGGSGAGFFTDGAGTFYTPECSTAVGRSFVNGGIGGQFDDWMPGGFGGGGSAWSGNGNGGGGGGYSGGGTCGSSFLGGGGGGSFNSGTNQVNSSGANTGDGIVIITPVFKSSIVQTLSISCYGFSTAVLSSSINGGSAPFTYTWLPVGGNASTANLLPAGTYTLICKDANEFITSSTYTVNQPSQLVITALATKTLICSGDSVVFNSSGASTYTWTNGITNGTYYTPNSSANYTVWGSLNGCVSSSTITISVNTSPTIAISGSTTICKGIASVLNANGALTYTWNNFSSSPSLIVSPTITSIYTVNGTNQEGCVGTSSVQVSVSECAALKESSQEKTFTLYPYPNNGKFKLELDGLVEGWVRIQNVIDEVVYYEKASKINVFQLEEIRSGIYYLTVSNETHVFYKTRFIKL